MNLERRLEEVDGTWPKAWYPRQPGDRLIGTIRAYGVGQSRFGPVRTCIVEQANGERVSLWLGSVVLLSEFNRLRPSIGERIAVKLLPTPAGKTYKRFAVLVDRDEEPSFEPLGGEAADVEAGPYTREVLAPQRAAASVGGRPAARCEADPFED